MLALGQKQEGLSSGHQICYPSRGFFSGHFAMAGGSPA